jgi:flagellar protein FlaI
VTVKKSWGIEKLESDDVLKMLEKKLAAAEAAAEAAAVTSVEKLLEKKPIVEEPIKIEKKIEKAARAKKRLLGIKKPKSDEAPEALEENLAAAVTPVEKPLEEKPIVEEPIKIEKKIEKAARAKKRLLGIKKPKSDDVLEMLEKKLAAAEAAAVTPVEKPLEEKPIVEEPIKIEKKEAEEAKFMAGEEAAGEAKEARDEFKRLGGDEALEMLEKQMEEAEKVVTPTEFDEYSSFKLPEGEEEVERYWINKPYAWAMITSDPESNERMYHVVEPNLTPGEKAALELIHSRLIDRLVYNRYVVDRDKALTDKAMELLSEYRVRLSEKSVKKLLYYLKRNYIGYGKIDVLLRDKNTEDVSCDGPSVPIFLYHRRHQSIKTSQIFSDEEELDLFVIHLVERAGKQISLGKPTVDATMPEGYRLQATLGTEVTTRGSSFTIRKFAEEPFTPTDLILYGTFSSDMLAYLWLATENKKNIVIIGGAASGKTCTLNALSMFIWPGAKITSIEETREIALYQENWVPSVTRPAPGERSIEMFELLRNALRQRPEVIIVGEVRGKEALVLFQAMTTGHTVYSTMHAGAVQEMAHRLEGEPIDVPHHMLSCLDIVCVQLLTYYRDQRVRRNQSTIEIIGIDPASGSLRTNRIYERNPLTDEFEKAGESMILHEIAKERGWSLMQLEKELRNRKRVLEYLAENNIRNINEVATIIRRYYFNPDGVLKQISAAAKK